MDFSAFRQPSFDAKEWVNSILAENRPSDEPQEAYLQGIIMKLQMHALEVGNQLEESSTQALAAIPRVLREVERLRKEMLGLKEKLNGFNERLYRIESHTDRSVRVLADIDRAKTRMEDCLKALEQVDKLSKLTADIEAVFATNDYRKIAEKIELMQHSVAILHGVEEYRDSVAQLSRLQARFETMVAPFIEQAISTHNIAESNDLMRVLQRVKRTEVFTQAYISYVGGSVEVSWQNGLKLSPAEDPTLFLGSFFDHASNVVAAETRWSSQVFPKESDIASAIITAIAIRIARLFSSFLELLSSRPRALLLLLSARTALQDFAQSLLPALGETPEATAQRQRLHRQLLAPFIAHQLHFPLLDRSLIADELDSLKAPLDGEHMIVIRRVEESVPKLLLILENSQSRCISFTRMEHADALVKYFIDVITDYTQHQQKAVQALRVRASLDSTPLPASLEGPTSVVPYDWSLFQGALRLVHVTSNLTTRLIQFDKTLRRALVEQRNQLFGASCVTDFKDQPINRNLVGKHLSQFSVTDDDLERIAQLLIYLLPIAVDSPRRVLQPAVTQAMALQSTAHGFAFDSVFQFVRGILAMFHTIKIWNAEEQSADLYSAQSLAAGLGSSSPLPYITQIGNHLWTLSVQHFDSPAEVERQTKGRASDGAALNVDGESESSQPNENNNNGDADNEALSGVAAQWVASVAKATVSLYIQRILELKSISAAGAKQLATDISYLCNFLTGLSIPIDPALSRLLELLSLLPSELAELPKAADDRLQTITESFVAIRSPSKPAAGTSPAAANATK